MVSRVYTGSGLGRMLTLGSDRGKTIGESLAGTEDVSAGAI